MHEVLHIREEINPDDDDDVGTQNYEYKFPALKSTLKAFKFTARLNWTLENSNLKVAKISQFPIFGAKIVILNI